MKLYLLTQTQEDGYDTYDSCIVSAHSEEDAKLIHPSPFNNVWPNEDVMYPCWAHSPAHVVARFIGETDEPRGVILASFNAG